MTQAIARITDNPEEHDEKIALYAAEERRVYEGFIASVIALRDEPDAANRRQLARQVRANFKHYLKINQDLSVLLGGMNEVNEYLRGQLREALAAVQQVKDLGYEEAQRVIEEIIIANLEDFLRVDKTAARRFARLIVYGEASAVLLENLHVIGECIEAELGGQP